MTDRRRHARLLTRPRLALMGAAFALVLAVLAVRWAAGHPALAAIAVLAVSAAVVLAVAGPLRQRVGTAAESRRRTEAAVRAEESRRALLETEYGGVATMTGPQFERLVARLLERDGCEDVRVSGGAGDRGADVTAIDPRGWRVVVQCKRYAAARPVGDPEIQRFLGTAFTEHRADTALFVTTSRFTRPARELARRRRVVLVDGQRLESWMVDRASPLPEDPLDDA